MNSSTLKILSRPFSIPSFLRQRGNFFLVYTMGKVGSLTVYDQLKKKLPFTPVFHAHLLAPSTTARIRNMDEKTERQKKGLKKNDSIKKFIEKEDRKLKVITLVRDPVGRVISEFFENPERYIFHDPREYEPNEIVSFIQDKKNLNYALEWFDEEFFDFMKFDLYQYSFDKEKGYSIYNVSDSEEVLVIKMEKLDQCFASAMYEFTGEFFQSLSKSNEKKNDLFYSKIKSSFKLSESELDYVYNSKFVNHFYDESEIQKFKEKWC